MSAATQNPNGGGGGKRLLLKAIGGTLFSTVEGLFLYLSIHFFGLNLATLGFFQIVLIGSVFFWSTTLMVFLFGKLPTVLVLAVAVVLLSLTVFSVYVTYLWILHPSVVVILYEWRGILHA